MKKILIYGLGNVGRNLAFYLAFDNEYEIGLISRSESKCRALILDLLPISNNVVDAGSIDLSSYDFLFVTAGISDEKNRVNFIINSKKMINDILLDVKSRGFSGNVIIISNPTDVLATYAYQKYHNDFKNILSTGTIIDSLRLKMIILK